MVAFSRALRRPNIRKRASTSKFDWPGRRPSCTSGISDSVQTPNTTAKVRQTIEEIRKVSLENSTPEATQASSAMVAISV